jgi:hypothetical protein
VNIVRLIFQNLWRGPISFRLPHPHQCTSETYRGLIQNDAERCVGCGSIDRCKPNTLSMESKLPPLYSTQGELRQVLTMQRKRPVRPAAAAAKPIVEPATVTANEPVAPISPEPVAQIEK